MAVVDLATWSKPTPAPARGKWDQVAYDNAYNAAKQGQPLDHAISNQSKYEEPTRQAYADFLASQSRGRGRGGSTVTDLPGLTNTGPTSTPEPPPEPPDLPNLPALSMSSGASLPYQLAKMQSIDSIPMQQAKVQAKELGAATGAIHSSQQAGAAQRAVQNSMMPLAKAEADLVGSQDIANWSTEVKRLTDQYEKDYAAYLAKLGFANDQKLAMATANTSLSQSLMSSITSLLNNPEIEFGPEVKNKLVSIYNTGLANNNTILDMGFSYA